MVESKDAFTYWYCSKCNIIYVTLEITLFSCWCNCDTFMPINTMSLTDSTYKELSSCFNTGLIELHQAPFFKRKNGTAGKLTCNYINLATKKSNELLTIYKLLNFKGAL